MFQSTRIKLTLWYVLISMLVSLSFSTFIYLNVTREFRRFEKFQIILKENPEVIPLPPALPPPRFLKQIKLNQQFVQETIMRIQLTLLGVNLIILGLSGIGGYFLAGLSLKPIKEMIDEQHRFITDASHELRTPLTVLKSEIEVSLRDKKLTISQAKDILNSNLEEVNNLQTLTDNLLELASYQNRPRSDIFQNRKLSPIIHTAIKKVSKSAKQKDITFKTTLSDFTICGNEISLCQLFIIILDNAIKYSPENSTIEITDKKTDGFVKVTISDHGIGIDQKDIPHIFKRFYRSDTARSKKELLGYGLGLSIAKKIAEHHLGSVKVESEKDKGAAFIVTLPIV